MHPVRATFHFGGRVQGVGFRWTAVRLLRDLPLTGYVRNLPDGRVELVAEGSPADLEQALARIRRALAGCIRTVQRTETSPTGEFRGFEIRR